MGLSIERRSRASLHDELWFALTAVPLTLNIINASGRLCRISPTVAAGPLQLECQPFATQTKINYNSGCAGSCNKSTHVWSAMPET